MNINRIKKILGAKKKKDISAYDTDFRNTLAMTLAIQVNPSERSKILFNDALVPIIARIGRAVVLYVDSPGIKLKNKKYWGWVGRLLLIERVAYWSAYPSEKGAIGVLEALNGILLSAGIGSQLEDIMLDRSIS